MKIAIAGNLPGIFNLSSPYPLDNTTFTKTLSEFIIEESH